MARNDSGLFSTLLTISLLGVGVLSLNGDVNGSMRPILVFTAGGLPMIFYHFKLMHSEYLTQDKIDSIYYFGFLVTLATLGSSAFILATKGNTAINMVGAQFALGLLVTGYGLWARISLQGKIISEENLNSSLDSYIDKVSLLNDGFNKTISLFNQLSTSAADDVRQAGLDVMSSISADIKAPTAEIRTHLKSFAVAIKKIDLASFENASKSIEDFSISIKSATSETPKLTQSMGSLSSELSKVNLNYIDLSKSIESQIQNIQGLSISLNLLSSSGNDASASITEFNNTMVKLNKIEISDVNSIADSLNKFFVAVEESTRTINSLKSSISQGQDAVLSTFDVTKISLEDHAKELNAATQELANTMSALAAALNQTATKMSR